MRTRTRHLLLTSAALCLLATPRAAADIPPPGPKPPRPAPPEARVEITAVRASGRRATDTRPAIPDDLASLADLLGKLGYDRYRREGAPVSRQGAARSALEFPDLPRAYSVLATWSPRDDGPGLLLSVTVRRQREPKPQEPETVASMQLRLEDDGRYLVKCPGAWPDGDLLLVFHLALVAQQD